MSEALSAFEARWADFDQRVSIVSGKELFAKLNTFLQGRYDISLSHGFVVRQFRSAEIHAEMRELVEELDRFGTSPVSDA